MKLISLKLENFRQHEDTEINFTDGITIISGTNGSGKSTILEAISWAIYGTEAARGTKDSIKFNRAKARSKVKAELVFSIDNETFRVVRELNKSEVYLEPNESPLAITQDEVTRYLIDKLGMNRVEFFNTYFTGQKELNFLGNQKPAERRKFISRVLNYEKVREAQEKVRLDKNGLSNEIIGLKQGLGNLDAIEEEKKQAKESLLHISEVLKEKSISRDKFAIDLGKIAPKYLELKNKREDFNKSNTELKFVLTKLEELKNTIEELEKENSSLDSKTKRLKELEKALIDYKKTEQQILEQEKLQKFEYEKQKLLSKKENIENEIAQNKTKIKESESFIEKNKGIPEKIYTLKQEIADLKEKTQNVWTEWTARKQELKALRKQKETELDKIAVQYSIIENKGENGDCPTCERPLKDEFKKVISGFQEVISKLSNEIQELISEEDSLTKEPEEIAVTKGIVQIKEKELEQAGKINTLFEQETKSLKILETEIDSKQELMQKIEAELKKIPEGFDKTIYEKLKEEIIPLKKSYEEALGLKAQVSNAERIKNSLDSAIKNCEESKNRKIELEASLKTLNYSEEEYKNLEQHAVAIEREFKQAELEVIRIEGEKNKFTAILEKIAETEKQFKEKQNLIKTRQIELNHLIELDRFYGQFLERLNNQARPEISEIASEFLRDLTEGRYTVLELNDKYEICLKEDETSDVKPVISGGEEDIANLCVRLAISKMIAQRSGRTLSLLILDEVFGSLDENRRDNVVRLLYNLTNDFEQVILITHIDDIKENIDNIIKVEYDEERGCSKVSAGENSALEFKDLVEV